MTQRRAADIAAET